MQVLEKFNLKDRVAVITGGAGLLGKHHAEAILEAGGIVVLADIDADRTNEVANSLSKLHNNRVKSFSTDITEPSSIESLKTFTLGEFKRIDILINNAALDPKVKNSPDEKPWSRFEGYPLDSWDKEIAVGLTGAMLCSRIIGSEMAQAGHGVIINIASDLGLIAPDQRLYKQNGLAEDMQPVKPVTYSVIKHGLIGLTRYLATYWADKGVRSNAICPGGVYVDQPEEFVHKLAQLIPMGRMANEDEYKAAILFLASDASSYMTGSVLTVDGGRTTW